MFQVGWNDQMKAVLVQTTFCLSSWYSLFSTWSSWWYDIFRLWRVWTVPEKGGKMISLPRHPRKIKNTWYVHLPSRTLLIIQIHPSLRCYWVLMNPSSLAGIPSTVDTRFSLHSQLSHVPDTLDTTPSTITVNSATKPPPPSCVGAQVVTKTILPARTELKGW